MADTTRIVSISESTLDGEQILANGRRPPDHQLPVKTKGPGAIHPRTRRSLPMVRELIVHTENHREVLRQSFHPSGELASSTITEYDDYQRITSQVTTDSDGKVIASRQPDLRRPGTNHSHRGS